MTKAAHAIAHQEPAQAAQAPQGALKPAEATKDLVYTFRISRRAAPIEFRNLWELAYKSPEDKEWQVLIDADMLSTVITHINYIFEQDGL